MSVRNAVDGRGCVFDVVCFSSFLDNRIGIALYEAITNAIYHGNLELDSALREDDGSQYHRLAAERRQKFPYCDRKVCIDATLNADLVRFVIHDDGPGFNVSDVSDPTGEENIGRASGRGLLLIHSFMDEVQHSSHGSQVSMLKYTSPGRALLASIEKQTRTSEKQTQASLTPNVVTNREHVMHSA